MSPGGIIMLPPGSDVDAAKIAPAAVHVQVLVPHSKQLTLYMLNAGSKCDDLTLKSPSSYHVLSSFFRNVYFIYVR